MKWNLAVLSFSSSLIFFNLNVYSYSTTNLKPRIQLQGTYATTDTNLLGDVDGLVPLFGNNFNLLFTDLTAGISNEDTWFIGPGLGYRTVLNNNLFGVYSFVDFEEVKPKEHFKIFNLGLEWFTPRWDTHVNGYIPFKRDKKIGPTVLASSLGDNSFLRFSGRSLTDELFAPMTGIGTGGDTIVGYSFDFYGKRARLYTGGYYYNYNSAMTNITGGLIGIQLPLSSFANVLLTEQYDNYNHNNILLTLRVSFGDNLNLSPNVSSRILDRIERHAGVNSTGAASFAQSAWVDQKARLAMMSNIWFFKETEEEEVLPLTSQPMRLITQTDCTFEHPCTNFGQEAINDIDNINPNAWLYLAPGNYPLSDSAALIVPAGQSIYGKTANYSSAAQGNERPLLTGAIQTSGNNVIDSLRICNQSVSTISVPDDGLAFPALSILDNNSWLIVGNNLELNSNMSQDNGFANGILISNGSINLTNSTIFAQNNSNASESNSFGIYALGDSDVDFKYVDINSQSYGTYAVGAALLDSSKLTYQNGKISSIMIEDGESRGVNLEGASIADFTNIAIDSQSSGSFATGAFLAGTANLTYVNSNIASIMTGAGESRTVQMYEASIANFININIDSQSSGSFANGAFLAGTANLTYVNSNIASIMTGAGPSSTVEMYGASIANFTNINIDSQSSGTFSIGAALFQSANLNYQNGNISNSMIGDGQSRAINLQGTSIANLTNIDLNSQSLGTFSYGAILGSSAKLTYLNGNISSTMTGSGQSRGLQLQGTSTANLSFSAVQVRSNNNATGLFNLSSIPSSLAFTSGTLDVAANTNASLTGGNQSEIIFSGENHCFLNGTETTCA